MKRTTYIFGAAFLTGLLLIIGVMSTITYWLPLHPKSLSVETTTISITDVHVIQLLTNDYSETMLIPKELVIEPCDSTSANTFSHPTADNISVSQRNDTLLVTYSKTEINNSTLNSMRLVCNSPIHRIDNQLVNTDIYLRRCLTDTLSITSASGTLTIDSCTMKALNIDAEINFYTNYSHIGNLHINLDKIHNWEIKNSNVNTQYLSGSSTHFKHLTANEYNKLIWIPKRNDAKLQILLYEPCMITPQR